MSAQTKTIDQMETEIDRMVEGSRTKLIMPILVLFYLSQIQKTGEPRVAYPLVRLGYEETVCSLIREHLHHNFNVGGEFNNTYIGRLRDRHGFLKEVSGRDFALVGADYVSNSSVLISYTIEKIRGYLNTKLADIVALHNIIQQRLSNANFTRGYYPKELQAVLYDKSSKKFRELLESGFHKSADGFLAMSYGFEICTFSILKVFLARFGCRIYRDSRTYASDKGTDISTNFGVIYQIKNYYLTNERIFKRLVDELTLNFSEERIQQGNVFLIMRNATNGFTKRLKDKKVNCLTKDGITDLLDKFTPEEKWQVLEQIDQEFLRELASDVCKSCRKPIKAQCPYAV